MTIVFDYAALETEMNAFARSARATASRPCGLDGIEGFQQAAINLRAIAGRNHTTPTPWTHSSWAPIQTTVSEGAFMRDRNDGEHIFAKLTFIWEIQNYGQFRRGGFRRFRLAGNCSTRIELVRERAPEKVVAMWRVEIAAHDGPGCHFHTQILGDDAVTTEVFPHSIDIPRFPGLLLTPTDALEFVLGELFQDDWRDRATDQSPDVMIWRGHQQERLARVLEWQRDAVRDALGSPWIALKNSKPAPNLFVDVGTER